MAGRPRVAPPKPEGCPAPVALAAALLTSYPAYALLALALCLLRPGPAGAAVIVASILLVYSGSGAGAVAAAAVGVLQVLLSGTPRFAVRRSLPLVSLAALAGGFSIAIAATAARGISPVDPMLYYASRIEVERLLIVYVGFSTAAVAYAIASPEPSVPSITRLASLLFSQPQLPFELILYGLGIYAAWQLQALLLPLAFAVGASVAVRFGAGKPLLAPLAYIATFNVLVGVLGLTPQLEALLP